MAENRFDGDNAEHLWQNRVEFMTHLSHLTAVAILLASATAGASDLQKRAAPETNPGALAMYTYVPAASGDNAPLVVVLHGCGQTADAYVTLAGWQSIADDYGFILLAPEQSQLNNFARCFNWFEPGDSRRDQGEARSIQEMILSVSAEEDVDPNRIFVTGLSAGGFMTSTMLALYPEVFAAGAVVAGGPFGCASSALGASTCMNGFVERDAEAWAEDVRDAAPAIDPMPRISIWHGNNDTTVSPNNAEELVKQWTEVHGLDTGDLATDAIAGHTRARYGTPVVVESIALNGIGHAVAVAPTVCGSVGAYAEDAGVCSSLEIARFWGLTDPPTPEDADAGATSPGDVDAGAQNPNSEADAGTGEEPDDGGGGCRVATGRAPLSTTVLLLALWGLGRLRRRDSKGC